MINYNLMSKEQLANELTAAENKYAEFKAKKLSLNMARGKPEDMQLCLSAEMFNILSPDDLISIDGTDCRNYGVFDGIPEAKNLMAQILGVQPQNVIVFGNSSLNVMYDTISRLFTHGTMGNTPWAKLDKVKFLCPSPGYDRHFLVTEHFGFELITIPMLETGPDMDIVENLVSNDSAVKGIWCIPQYSNPTGYTYSDETVRRFAALKPAAPDFRIFWDNAYLVHHLYDEPEKQDKLLDILTECEKAGNPNMVYEFCSTSKISLPGSGIAAMTASAENIAEFKKSLTVQTIGHDKINQLRHARFFKNLDGVKAHMSKHAAIIRPKFDAVLDIFEKELGETGLGKWTKPNGGYFISFDALDGCAKEIVQKCKEAGMILTAAGATFPYKIDPNDKNIRIAPTFPSLDEIKIAAELFCTVVKMVSYKKLINKK